MAAEMGPPVAELAEATGVMPVRIIDMDMLSATIQTRVMSGNGGGTATRPVEKRCTILIFEKNLLINEDVSKKITSALRKYYTGLGYIVLGCIDDKVVDGGRFLVGVLLKRIDDGGGTVDILMSVDIIAHENQLLYYCDRRDAAVKTNVGGSERLPPTPPSK